MAEETPRNEKSAPQDVDIDLSSLNDLALGPRWSSGPVPANQPRQDFREERERPERGSRPARGMGQGPAPRRDRRPPQRPQGEGPADAARPAPSGQPRGERPQRADGRPPREDGAPRREGGPRRDDRGPRREFSRSAPPPPFKPVVQAAFYPEENPFKLLSTAIKNSARTYELFEIARLILEKPDRFVVVMHPLPEAQPQTLFISVPDNVPFLSEDAAMSHVFTAHADKFFEIEEVEVDPPKGNFQIVNRCGITGELLAPPNYHRYQQILQAHYSARIGNMPYERFLSRVEGVREKESIDQWVEKMRKQTRYKLKEAIEGAPSEYESMESARFQLVLHAKEKLVRAVANTRFEGKLIEQMPAGAVRQSLETILEAQRRFPLDTANNLRGRLRRLGFSVYKKGSKGISYVCAIRRAFRKPGEVFGESVQQLIEFIEAHPGFPASELPKQYLGTEIPAEGETAMPAEDQERLRLLRNDLRWLITSGYVTEYSNGKLFAPPPMEGSAPSDDEPDTKDIPGVTIPAPQVEAPAEPSAAAEQPEAIEEAPELVTEAAPEAVETTETVEVTEAAEAVESPAEEAADKSE